MDKTQYCSLCNRDASELEAIGEETLFYGNRELEREDLRCHHYFCQGCRFWMHRNNVRTCRVCEGDISEIIRSELSCNCKSNSQNKMETNEKPKEQESKQENKQTENLNKLTRVDLRRLCKERNIKGYSKLKKQEMIDLLFQ